MKTTINGTEYQYVENIFGNKILIYFDLGGNTKVCGEELVCDQKIKTIEHFKQICNELEGVRA